LEPFKTLSEHREKARASLHQTVFFEPHREKGERAFFPCKMNISLEKLLSTEALRREK
jgi:hypothetical protein